MALRVSPRGQQELPLVVTNTPSRVRSSCCTSCSWILQCPAQVTCCRLQELAGTNEVYVSPTDPAARLPELQIAGMCVAWTLPVFTRHSMPHIDGCLQGVHVQSSPRRLARASRPQCRAAKGEHQQLVSPSSHSWPEEGVCLQVIRASLNEQIVARVFIPPQGGFDAMLMHIQLSMLGKRAVVAAGGEVNALDLSKHITRTYQAQVQW